jgi:hypothetical protein
MAHVKSFHRRGAGCSYPPRHNLPARRRRLRRRTFRLLQKGKAQFARFDLGENDQNEFADASFTMTDPDAAEQLKNLLLGIKALVSLSQQQQRPFIDPLQINSFGKDVILHWEMPRVPLKQGRPPCTFGFTVTAFIMSDIVTSGPDYASRPANKRMPRLPA